MNRNTKYPLQNSMRGFAIYVGYRRYMAADEISLQDDYPDLLVNKSLKNYNAALKIVELDRIFEEKLTDREREAIRYLVYHNPDEKEPLLYDVYIDLAYRKWSRVFFYANDKSKIYKQLRPRHLGKLMRRIRLNNNVDITTFAKAMELAVRTVERYESGDAVPSLPYIISFCSLFNIDLNQLVSESTY